MLDPLHVAGLLGEALGAALPDPPLAYIGPGAGLGAIAITIALLLAVVLLVVGLVWYPLKRLFKARTGDAANSSRPDRSE